VTPATESEPSRWPRPGRRPPSLAQCLLLAVLLHLLLVLLIGTVPGGGAADSASRWGDLRVTLRGPLQEGVAKPEPAEADTGPQGTARQRRYGGAVRERPAQPLPDQPGAAELGRPQATPPPAPAPETTAPAPSAEPPP
jgi:hypothetical protein